MGNRCLWVVEYNRDGVWEIVCFYQERSSADAALRGFTYPQHYRTMKYVPEAP